MIWNSIWDRWGHENIKSVELVNNLTKLPILTQGYCIGICTDNARDTNDQKV